MKILHIHHSLLFGGIESLLCGLVNEQSKRNDVTLCTWFVINKEEGLEPLISKRVNRISLNNKCLDAKTKLTNILKLYRVIRRGNYDVVNVHNNFNYYILSILLLKKKIKFFYTIHSDAVRENGPLSGKTLFIKRLFFKKRWIIPITISPQSQQSFFNLYHCDSYMILNGIRRPEVKFNSNELNKYKINPATRVFVHIGRICLAKNQVTLCKTFKRLIQEGYDIMLLIIGPREDETIWMDLQPYFSDRIIFVGPRNDATMFLIDADAMCLPSVYEGLPITLLESIALGCVPICSPVGGIPTVVKNGYNGILSDSSSEIDYYETMKRFLTTPIQEIETMKRNAILSFEKYDVSEVAKKYENTYQTEINYGKPEL